MVKDNDQLAREQDLARQYEIKMARRDREIQSQGQKHATGESHAYIRNGLHRCFQSKFSEAFSQNRYEKPSEFFLKEMPWIFGLAIYDRYKEAFLHMVDGVRDFPYSESYFRRSFRSNSYMHYMGRIGHILYRMADVCSIDADVKDILSGNLPEEAMCYSKHKATWNTPYVSEMLAYALDQNDPELEAVVTDIVNGDNGFVRVSWSLVEGIVMSHNPRMHQLLCRLLLAAKLQEGLRMVICERADCGTIEAFHAILTTILENDLIRYSAVKRAVGTWIGVMSEETRDIDRISNKSVELIAKCLKDSAFREECLESEDAMAIHIALWSGAFENMQSGYQVLDRIIESGTHHQVLTAGYFVANLDNELIRHIAARNVLKARREHNDILAVYLPSFLPGTRYLASTLWKDTEIPNQDHYFQTKEQAREFCDWMMAVHTAMKKKSVEFSPCIFPWFTASLKKSDLVEKAMVIAAMIGDQEQMDKLCPRIPDCDAIDRGIYLKLLSKGRKTPAVRKAIIEGLQDKSFDTRQAAFEQAKGLALTGEEYRQVEDMLRLKYDDLRRNAMELLLKQSDDDLEASVKRLLASSKTAMRTAGLDMVTQLQKSENREAVAAACMAAVRAIAKPTTQEQVLIDALLPKEEICKTEPLFTEADRYVPTVEIGAYEKDCIRAFMEMFPDSKMEQQVLSGKKVIFDEEKQTLEPCESARKAYKNLKSLSDFFVAHERETFTVYSGHEIPLGTGITSFGIWDSGKQRVPRMDLWERWVEENQITPSDLLCIMILTGAQPDKYPYLVQCGKYVCDVFGAGLEKPVTYRYLEHMQRIAYELILQTLGKEQYQKIALALGIWIARCLPEEMLLGVGGEITKDPPNSGADDIHVYIAADGFSRSIRNYLNGPVGHFIAHPQFRYLIYGLEPGLSTGLEHRIPFLLNIYERTYASTSELAQRCNLPTTSREPMVLDQMFRASYHQTLYFSRRDSRPDVSIYLYARHFGLISERTLYYHLMEPDNLKQALGLVTSVTAIEPRNGDQVSAKTFQHYHSYGIRRTYGDFVGTEVLPREEQVKLVALCHDTAEKILPIILDSELRRGDTPAEYSAHIMGIHALSGAETFVRILRALGKDSLDRSVYYWTSSHSKRGNLSYLLARCAPAVGDDAAKLAQLLKNTDITEKRLIEAALYSPAWIEIIGEYLNLPGFQSACYYFMAHMNEKFDDQKKAIIARYTPLSEDELNLGAFDVDWFRSAFEQLGEKKFDLIYDAAKYISDGAKHTRARKYADAALGRFSMEETEATIKDKRNKDLLMAYAIIPLKGEEDLIHRYLYLQQFLKESRQFGSQRSASEKKAVETALRNLATNAGFSDTMRLTLRMETKLVENNQELFHEKQVGEWVFRLAIDDQGTPEILCTKDGKLLKSIPAKAKKEAYVVRLQDMKKQLTDQYRRTRRMFEQAMEDGAEFTLEEMQQLWENPVVAPIVAGLFFVCDDKIGLFDGKTLNATDSCHISDDKNTKIRVAHPLHLYRSGCWHSIQKYLFDNKIVQPFRQVFRELYVKTKEELGCFTSLRYAGNQIQPKKAAACLKERRWVADIEAGLQKIYYQDNIVATIYALADWFTPADIEAPTLEYVAFYDRKTGQAMKIDEIPDVIFSEVMRDVDMAVSVAHAGGVDPETSHSTVEMRAAILSFTLPLLKLGNVEVKGSHAFIDGKLGNYSVHLGSGVVHQLGGTMLNVLPVHSQNRGRFFLPFLDEDPKTAEIISKVILFAEDYKLKDPTILCQITG